MVHCDAQEPQKEEQPGDHRTHLAFETAGGGIKFNVNYCSGSLKFSFR